MKRVVFAAAVAAILALPAVPAQAQFKGFGNDSGSTNKDSKTGRTSDGIKIDQEIDRLYRSRVGQKTPEVRSDPWGDVRSPANTAAPAAEHKKPAKASSNTKQ